MAKGLSFILMLFMLTIAAEARNTSIGEEFDVIMVYAETHNSSDYRDHSISADITGHTLTINFNEDVGIAQIVIRNSNGIYIDSENVFSTPDYATFYINDAGYYRMDITLSNGEQYYGYFQVDN